jgi:predicted nucleotidyltransferase component of viral defense system
MKSQRTHNKAASVRQKLLNLARERSEDFQLVLTQYALERFLFRLGVSKHAEDFVLKGAFLYRIWTDQPYRPTRDLDFLGFIENVSERLVAVFKDLCDIDQDDGLVFQTDSISAEEIREDLEYTGLRMTLMAKLGVAKIPLQIDIGFGDVVTPRPKYRYFPTILSMPSPRIRVYSKESVIAEKYEAMVRLGIANSRMKDFYDIWILAKEFNFQGQSLSRAIKMTFSNRKTALPENTPLALRADFIQDPVKQTQWTAFLTRTRLNILPGGFEDVIDLIRSFLLPPTDALIQGKPFKMMWTPGEQWEA